MVPVELIITENLFLNHVIKEYPLLKCAENEPCSRTARISVPLLLAWINFNHNMEK